MPPSFLHSTSMTWPWTLGLGTKESSPLCTTPGRWKPLPATLETLGLESPRTSTSDRYPKGCSPWIYGSIKTCALFSFQVLPVSRWGREQVFTDGKGMLPYWWVVSEISRVHWQGGISGSIRQFLKPTGHQQLEVGGFGLTWSPQSTDYGIVAEQPANDSCRKSSLGFGLNH